MRFHYFRVMRAAVAARGKEGESISALASGSFTSSWTRSCAARMVSQQMISMRSILSRACFGWREGSHFR
jgi:hypothetical protein